MSTRNVTAWWLKLLGASFLSLAFAFASPAIAQDEADEEAAADEQAEVEEIVVTGSRLKRSTYTSVSPLQVITAEVSREVGLIDPASILQESTAAGGVQFDLSFQGLVLDNGPGAQTVSLRGLGAARTLVLVNGRRMAPSGVQGAPVAPDLSLIPSTLIAQYDVLLDGASSVYGSDAVAGVTNIITRKDFDGLEVQAFSYRPEQTGGVENTLSLAWGKNFDRGFIGMGIEYSDSEGVRLSERSWTADCSQHYEVDQNGNIRSQDQYYPAYYGMDSAGGCLVNLLAGRMAIPNFGSIYYTEGTSNIGVPNFSESSCPYVDCGVSSFGVGAGMDRDFDGVADVNFFDYDLNGREREAHLFSEQERISAMAYGEYTFEGESNITPFFEISYNQKDTFADSGAYQLFPDVPADNPYNPCNPDAEGGADCGAAWNNLLDAPDYAASFVDVYGFYCPIYQAYGPFIGLSNNAADWTTQECATFVYWLFGLYEAEGVGMEVTPIVSVNGDRTEVTTDVEQIRIVAGLRGDLPNFGWGEMANWSWEVAAIHTESKGISMQPGVRDDRLNLALGWYSTTNTPCENDTGEILASDVAPGCVPINMFAPSLYDGVVGDFATAAERNYVFDVRDFDTRYQQQLISAFLSGDLMDTQYGPVAAGIGVEWRRDEIDSLPDNIARDGLMFGFYRDGGAIGEKDTKEIFGEIEIPLLANRPLAEELTLNLSTRLTKDEFYSSSSTYSAKIGYRPLQSLLLRGTYGTSYRAPNLRENFLVELSGFGSVSDPCVVPDEAEGPGGIYQPENDRRPDYVLENCFRTGVDPTALSNNGFSSYSVESAKRRGVGLTEETSSSLSYGFVWEQPFFESFDMTFGATYYRIEVDNTLVHPSTGYIVSDCYYDAELNSSLCEFIERGEDGFIEMVRRPVINRDNETVEGVDVNIAFDKSVTMFGRNVDLGIDFMANRSLEQSELFRDSDGNPNFDDDQGEFGFPNWKGQINLRAEVGDWRFRWTTNFLGAVEPDADYLTDFNDVWDSQDTGWYGDTCFGPSEGDVLCRDKVDVGKYMIHTASVYYRGDRWNVGLGVRNIFDEEPPRIDGYAGSYGIYEVSNVPIGYGYDLNGRTVFLDIKTSFDY